MPVRDAGGSLVPVRSLLWRQSCDGTSKLRCVSDPSYHHDTARRHGISAHDGKKLPLEIISPGVLVGRRKGGQKKWVTAT